MFRPAYSCMPAPVWCEWSCVSCVKGLKTWPEFKDLFQRKDVCNLAALYIPQI